MAESDSYPFARVALERAARVALERAAKTVPEPHATELAAVASDVDCKARTDHDPPLELEAQGVVPAAAEAPPAATPWDFAGYSAQLPCSLPEQEAAEPSIGLNWPDVDRERLFAVEPDVGDYLGLHSSEVARRCHWVSDKRAESARPRKEAAEE